MEETTTKMSKFEIVTRNDFIKMSRKIFGGSRFNYSKVSQSVIGPRTEVILTCVVHGDFVVTAESHLRSTANGGCHRCRSKKNVNHNRKKRNEKKNKMLNEMAEMAKNGVVGFKETKY